MVNWFRDGAWASQVFEHDGWISSIATDANGTVWAGTSRGGLDRNADGKEDEHLAGRAAGGIKHTVDGRQWGAWTLDNSPLVTNDIEVIRVAPNGDVWIGTNGWGLMRFGSPLPVVPFSADSFEVEVEPSTVNPQVGETWELTVSLSNNSRQTTFSVPRFRPHIEQDPSSPVLEPVQPELIFQSEEVGPGGNASATLSLRAVRPGTVTLSLDAIGEVNLASNSAWHMTSISAQSATITVGEKSYLPFIILGYKGYLKVGGK